MATVRRVLGKRGRTTIPYEFRQILDMRNNDVLTFSMNDERNCVIITKDRICNDCIRTVNQPRKISIFEVLEQLNREEKLYIIGALSSMILADEGGDSNET